MNIIKYFRVAAAAAALLLGVAQTAKAEIVTVTGNTTGAATADFSWFGFGAAGTYNAFTFDFGIEGDYSLFLTSDFDSVFVLYEGTFDPRNTRTNFLVYDHDPFNGVTGAFGIAGHATPARYSVVVIGANDNAHGPLSLTVGGPSVSLVPVPEPATWAMLAMGLALVGYAQRRRTQR